MSKPWISRALIALLAALCATGVSASGFSIYE